MLMGDSMLAYQRTGETFTTQKMFVSSQKFSVIYRVSQYQHTTRDFPMAYTLPWRSWSH